MAVCVALLAYNWNSVKSEALALFSITTDNPTYLFWPTEQAFRGLHDFEQDVRLAEAGSAVAPDQLATHLDVLISGLNLMLRSSKLNDDYMKMDEFVAVQPLLRAFATDILPSIGTTLARSEARALRPQLEELKRTLRELSMATWIHDSFKKDQALKNIRYVLRIVGIVAGLLFCAVISLLALWCRYQAAVTAKERALAGLQTAATEKLQFLGMIGHELRTPLQVIISTVELMEKRHFRDENDAIIRARRAVDSLSVQLRDILTLARSEAGYIELQHGGFDAIELVKEVVRDHRPTAEAKGLELRLTCHDEAIFVSSDAERIRQILNNLVSNAVKYTLAGYIHVEALPCDPRPAQLQFRVTDTGPGLPAGMLGGETNKLHQLRGRGIGLTVVQTLSTQLGAHLTFRTNKDGGSIFDISVPVVPLDDGMLSALKLH